MKKILSVVFAAMLMFSLASCGEEISYESGKTVVTEFMEAYKDGSEDEMAPLFSEYVSSGYSERLFLQIIDGNLDIIEDYADDICGGTDKFEYSIGNPEKLSDVELLKIKIDFAAKKLDGSGIDSAEVFTVSVIKSGSDGELESEIKITVIGEKGEYRIFSQDLFELKESY